MARSQIGAPGRVMFRSNFKRGFDLTARPASPHKKKATAPCVAGKAALPATPRTGEGYHNRMVEGKNNPCSVTGGRDDGSHSFTAMAKSVSLYVKTTNIRKIWGTPQGLITVKTKAAPFASFMNRKRLSNLMSQREAPSHASATAIAEAAASQPKNTVLITKWGPASSHPPAKVAAASPACTSKPFLETNGKANHEFAAGHINYGSTLSANKGKKRGPSLMFEEPGRRPLQKKPKREPFDARRAVQERRGMFRELAVTLLREKETKPDLKAFKRLKGIGRTPTRNIWNTPQGLINSKTKAAPSASLVNRREAPSPASATAIAKAAASQHKSTVLITKKWERASCHHAAKAAAASAARMSSLETDGKAIYGFAINYSSTLSAKKGKNGGPPLVFDEPGRPPLQKKPKREPFDARRAVQKRLGMFRRLAVTLQREKETNPDLKAFKLLKEVGRTPTRKYLGEVPGVEVGDEFYYRSELMVAGLHGSAIRGIDSMPFEGRKVATCVISSKGYINIMEGTDVLVYSGEGGNPSFESARKGPPADQRLAGGNLALKNSMGARTPVRVVHGFAVPRGGAESLESKAKTAVKYVYDGLYLVEDFWWETGRMGFRVLKFQMRRMPGQPKLELKQVWRSRAARKRHGQCTEV